MADPHPLRHSTHALVATLLALLTPLHRLPAQQEAVVEQVASVLAAEDARSFDPAVFGSALVSPDSVARRLAA